nr:MAG TPA: hypothetical protein [Inoviridae sp.]
MIFSFSIPQVFFIHFFNLINLAIGVVDFL